MTTALLLLGCSSSCCDTVFTCTHTRTLAHIPNNTRILFIHSRVFLGPTPVYFIADMDLFKDITVKHFDKFVDRIVSGVPSLINVKCL